MGLKQYVKTTLGAARCTLAGVKAGRGVYVGSRVHIVNGSKLVLGDAVQIRPDCDLFAGGVGITMGNRCDVGTRNRIVGDVFIGDAVLFGPDNYVCSLDHCFGDISRAVMDQGAYAPTRNGHSDLRIGDGSWVGIHCAIIGDVHIGKHCVIGANSVVTRDVPDYCVVAGAPAKIIKRYNFESGAWERDAS